MQLSHTIYYIVLCISVAGPVDGGTLINYGCFQEMAAKWMDNEAGDSRFANPQDTDEAELQTLARDLVMILAAG
jgi:hypothetical protein